MDKATHAEFSDIVLEGKRADTDMASFAGVLSLADVQAIHAYVISRANEDCGHTSEHE